MDSSYRASLLRIGRVDQQHIESAKHPESSRSKLRLEVEPSGPDNTEKVLSAYSRNSNSGFSPLHISCDMDNFYAKTAKPSASSEAFSREQRESLDFQESFAASLPTIGTGLGDKLPLPYLTSGGRVNVWETDAYSDSANSSPLRLFNRGLFTDSASALSRSPASPTSFEINPSRSSAISVYCSEKSLGNMSANASASPSKRSPYNQGTPHLLQTCQSSDDHVYQVRFKLSSRFFLLHPTGPSGIQPGDFVRVEGDRGDDIGVVQSRTHVTLFREHIPTAGFRGRGFSYGHGVYKWLYGLCSKAEVVQLRDKAKEEEEALEVARAKVTARGLPMRIVDAEYQADRHKLIFYFEAQQRIDFRDLVQELFGIWKTRIWMHQVQIDSTFKEDDEEGARLSKAAGLILDAPAPPSQCFESFAFGIETLAYSTSPFSARTLSASKPQDRLQLSPPNLAKNAFIPSSSMVWYEKMGI